MSGRSKCFLVVVLAAVLVLSAGSCATKPPRGARRRSTRDVTFLVTSDCHYDAFENEDRNERNRDTIKEMNAIAKVPWPENLGGGTIRQPRGDLVRMHLELRRQLVDRLVPARRQGHSRLELRRTLSPSLRHGFVSFHPSFWSPNPPYSTVQFRGSSSYFTTLSRVLARSRVPLAACGRLKRRVVSSLNVVLISNSMLCSCH